MRKHIVLAEPGGIYTPKQIKKVAQMVSKGSLEGLHLGERQELLFAPHYSAKEHNSREVASMSCWSLGRNQFNPMCSQMCGGLDGVLDWAYEEDVYREILDAISTPPSFRVGLIHPEQVLMPRLANDLNFYPSEQNGFWALLLNVQGDRLLLSRLIPTDSVVKFIETCESHLKEKNSFMGIVDVLSEELSEDWPKSPSLELPSYAHRDLEGFLSMSSGRYALNLYNNHHPWSVAFVVELMDMAQANDIAQVYVTGGRSLLIKHIRKSDLLLWEGLLSRHNMTIRHSAADLAWIVGSHQPRNVRLKRRIQRRLEREGISFSQTAISIDPPRLDDRATIFIVPRRNWYGNRYELLHKKGFDPLAAICLSVAGDMTLAELLEKLVELHQKLYARSMTFSALSLDPMKLASSKVTRYECPECLTCYDEAFGDPARGIAEGTSFTALSEDWSCELCEAPKADFLPLVEQV